MKLFTKYTRINLLVMVIVFLLIFSVLIYLTKRSVYAKAGAH